MKPTQKTILQSGFRLFLRPYPWQTVQFSGKMSTLWKLITEVFCRGARVRYRATQREAGVIPARSRRCERGARFMCFSTAIALRKVWEGEPLWWYASQKTCTKPKTNRRWIDILSEIFYAEKRAASRNRCSFYFVAGNIGYIGEASNGFSAAGGWQNPRWISPICAAGPVSDDTGPEGHNPSGDFLICRQLWRF